MNLPIKREARPKKVVCDFWTSNSSQCGQFSGAASSDTSNALSSREFSRRARNDRATSNALAMLLAILALKDVSSSLHKRIDVCRGPHLARSEWIFLWSRLSQWEQTSQVWDRSFTLSDNNSISALFSPISVSIVISSWKKQSACSSHLTRLCSSESKSCWSNFSTISLIRCSRTIISSSWSFPEISMRKPLCFWQECKSIPREAW